LLSAKQGVVIVRFCFVWCVVHN